MVCFFLFVFSMILIIFHFPMNEGLSTSYIYIYPVDPMLGLFADICGKPCFFDVRRHYLTSVAKIWHKSCGNHNFTVKCCEHKRKVVCTLIR